MVEKEVLKGTTTVGLVFDGGVVVAADKRATMGHFIAGKSVDKVFEIGDKIVMTTAGGVGDAQALVRLMKAELELYKYHSRGPLTVEGAATLLANVLQGHKYFPYFVQLIVAGHDGEPRLFDLDLAGGLMPDNVVSTGSGSVTAYGILDEGFKEKMPQEDAVKLAARAVNAAMRRDSATGEGIDVVCITKGGVKKYSKEEVKSFLE